MIAVHKILTWPAYYYTQKFLINESNSSNLQQKGKTVALYHIVSV